MAVLSPCTASSHDAPCQNVVLRRAKSFWTKEKQLLKDKGLVLCSKAFRLALEEFTPTAAPTEVKKVRAPAALFGLNRYSTLRRSMRRPDVR